MQVKVVGVDLGKAGVSGWWHSEGVGVGVRLIAWEISRYRE